MPREMTQREVKQYAQDCRAERFAKDRDMITHPNDWPRWPFLPVKRTVKGTFPIECGVIFEGSGLKTVFVSNLFSLPETIEKFHNLKNYKYDTIDELLDDGWIVD